MAKRTIPQIRKRLHEIAADLNLPEIAELAEETKRQYHGRRAPVRALTVDEEIAEQVKAYALANPNAPQREIGQKFQIDGGRVSEILHGRRGE